MGVRAAFAHITDSVVLDILNLLSASQARLSYRPVLALSGQHWNRTDEFAELKKHNQPCQFPRSSKVAATTTRLESVTVVVDLN
jgi:hypothetical protein